MPRVAFTDVERPMAANFAKLPEMLTKTGGRWGPSPEVLVENLRGSTSPGTTTNIAAVSASSAAFIAVTE
jgi:hypothetical protein